jgi:NAD(P)-dependent dehydrogenase (short-subunit alcohol dehydrogenase family)
MKVFVLGASGTYGSGTAKLLANDDRVEAIALAARNTDKLEALAKEIGAKACIVQADASDSAALCKTLGGYDVLVNATGYYQELIGSVLDATISTNIAYVDISEPTEAAEMAFGRHESAQAAGCTALIGVGSTPGVTTMLGLYAASQLDHCQMLDTGFVVAAGLYFSDDEQVMKQIRQRQKPVAVHQTIIEIMADPVWVVQEGSLVTVDPMEARRKVKLAGYGEAWVYPIAMSTPVTLHEHLPQTDSISVCTAFLPDEVNAILYRYAQNYKRGEADLQTVVSEMFAEVGRLSEEQKSTPLGLPAYLQWACASGEKDGQKITVNVGLSEPLTTVAAFAAGALALGSGAINKPGVWPVEACFEPMQFFDAVSQVQYSRAYNIEALLMEKQEA